MWQINFLLELTNTESHCDGEKNTEFNFSKDRKEIIVEVLKIIREYNFEIYAIYLNKSKLGNMAKIIDKNKLYNWTIAELLKSIPLENAKIIQVADLIAGSINRSLEKGKTDARAYISILKNKIRLIKEIY